jgi:uncharacterized Zn finger protein
VAGRGRWNSPWERYGPSTPIRVDGGLATSRPRGSIADSWWSRRFVQTLESYGLGGRLERGRRYARQGQIVSLDISPGLLAAQVQGSRPTPYLVSIVLASPTERQWRIVDAALLRRVGLAAHLLAGELPADLEDVFAEAKAPLFPTRWADLKARCNCPDATNPCKHIAAVLYLFADRLDDDPWLLLEWRGRSRGDVLTALGLNAAAGESDLPPWWPLRPGEPLPSVGERGHDPMAAEPPVSPDGVLRRLDDLDVVAWKMPVSEVLPAVYAAVQADDGPPPATVVPSRD